MRTCARCHTEMVEDCELRVHGVHYGINLIKISEKLFGDKNFGRIKPAVCPNCGEVSLYIDDPRGIQ